jgi:hypothetical protein
MDAPDIPWSDALLSFPGDVSPGRSFHDPAGLPGSYSSVQIKHMNRFRGYISLMHPRRSCVGGTIDAVITGNESVFPIDKINGLQRRRSPD